MTLEKKIEKYDKTIIENRTIEDLRESTKNVSMKLYFGSKKHFDEWSQNYFVPYMQKFRLKRKDAGFNIVTFYKNNISTRRYK